MSDAASPLWLWLILIFIIFSRVSSADQENITAESGQDVILTCRAPNISDPEAVLEWSKTDLGAEYVLLYRDGHIDGGNQHPSFKNRVKLQDRQMEDGKVSLILKQVSINDTGTYECRVSKGGANRKKRSNLKTDPISIIYLRVVAPPGQPGGLTEDGSVGLIVGLLLSVLVAAAAVVGFVIYKKCKPQSWVSIPVSC